MFALLTAAVLVSQAQSSLFVGSWEGTLSFEKNGQTDTIVIRDLTIDSEMNVSGEYVISEMTKLYGVLTTGKLIDNKKLFKVFFRPSKDAIANARLEGPVEIIGEGDDATLVSKTTEKPKEQLSYREFNARGAIDDESYPAKLSLRRKKPKGPPAPLFYPKTTPKSIDFNLLMWQCWHNSNMKYLLALFVVLVCGCTAKIPAGDYIIIDKERVGGKATATTSPTVTQDGKATVGTGISYSPAEYKLITNPVGNPDKEVVISVDERTYKSFKVGQTYTVRDP